MFAQKANVTGRVTKHEIGSDVVYPASLVSVRIRQGSISNVTKTDLAGNFSFKEVPFGDVVLSITLVGSDVGKYKPFSETVTLSEGDNVVFITLDQIQQSDNDKEADSNIDGGELDQAVVSGSVPALAFRGDTLVYRTAGVQNMLVEGDYAIEALKNMPGVRVENGALMVFGNNVTRTYVNGALIFGQAALKPFENIKAEEMVSFEVYDEEERHENIARMIKVADIKTKNPIFSVIDIQSALAVGVDQQLDLNGKPKFRYFGLVDGNFYSELFTVSSKISGSNVGAKSSLQTMFQALSSNQEDVSAGVKMEKYWKSRIGGDNVKFDYNYSRSSQSSSAVVLTDYFGSENQPARMVSDSSMSSSVLESHQISSSASYGRSRTSTTIYWNGTAGFSSLKTDNFTSSLTRLEGMNNLVRNESDINDRKSWFIDQKLSFNLKQFKKFPNFGVEGHTERNDGVMNLVDTTGSSSLRRFMVSNLREKNDRIAFDLAAPFSSMGWYMAMKYILSYQDMGIGKYTTDYPGTDKEAVNLANTYEFNYRYLKHSLNLVPRRIHTVRDSSSVSSGKVRTNFTLNMSRVNSRLFYSLEPTVNIYLNTFSSINYYGSAQLPALEQMMPRINDSNPLTLRSGNPSIRQSFIHKLSAAFANGNLMISSMNSEKQSDLIYSLSVDATLTTNPIVPVSKFFSSDTWLSEQSYLAKAGSVLTTYDNALASFSSNVTGELSSKLSLSGMRPVLSLKPALSYMQIPRYFAESLDVQSELSPSILLSASNIRFDNLRLSSSASVTYSRSSSRSGSFANELLRVVTDVKADYRPTNKTYIKGLYSWKPFRVLSGTGRNADLHELDVECGLSLMKQALHLSVSGVNLLNGGNLYSSTMSETSFSQSWKPVFGRYFMLSLTYRFNHGSQSSLYR